MTLDPAEATESDPLHVVDFPSTEKYHRSHPAMLLRPACDPEKNGTLVREADARGSRCQHQACFGVVSDA